MEFKDFPYRVFAINVVIVIVVLLLFVLLLPLLTLDRHCTSGKNKRQYSFVEAGTLKKKCKRAK